MKKVLITGASGFIGRRLAAHLAGTGWAVRGSTRRLSDALPKAAATEWVETGNLGPETDWESALEGISHVIHLAGLAHQTASKNPPSEEAYSRINTLGTLGLAKAMARAGKARRLIFLSSIGAVATLSETVLDENSPPRPDTPYGRSKLAAERAIIRTLKDPLPDWCIIRAPLLYGSGNPGNMARLLKKLKGPLPLPLGSIRNRRSFLYVGNLTDFMTTALEHPHASRQLFCLSDGEDLSTPEFIRRICRHTRRPARIFPFPLPLLKGIAMGGDLFRFCARRSIGLDSPSLRRLSGSLFVDCGKARQLMDWTPPWTIEEGVMDMVEDL